MTMDKPMDKPSAVFFDWDGTLVNTLPALRAAHNHVRTSYGYGEWTHEEFLANLRHSARELYPRLYGENAPEALDRLYSYVRTHHLATLEVLDGAEDLLKAVAAVGIPCGLVSNKKHEVLVREVGHLGWDRYFLACVGAGQARRDKPAADSVLLALERSGISIDIPSMWYVGDTVTDLLVAKDLGCKAVFLLDGESKADLVLEYAPFIVAENRRTLNDIINRFH